MTENEIEKEIKKIDKSYSKKLDKLYEMGKGRSKEAKLIKKEWIEKALPLGNKLKELGKSQSLAEVEEKFRVLALHLAHIECPICQDKISEFEKFLTKLKQEKSNG